ncbi:hypothetical protein NFS00_15385 [Enterobacter hormaechei]|nr:hypothetical protein [Enterobacter hormaechei]MCO6022406.1 hypothetical protein [Enterobacter hormaechei]
MKLSRCVCGIKKTPGGGYALPGLREQGKGWFCRPGKRSTTRRNLQRPPIPPGLLRPVQRRIGAGDDFRPDWLDGWCETKSVCVRY